MNLEKAKIKIKASILLLVALVYFYIVLLSGAMLVKEFGVLYGIVFFVWVIFCILVSFRDLR